MLTVSIPNVITVMLIALLAFALAKFAQDSLGINIPLI